ncbi:MAG: hypothetical protein H6Q73_1653 [Firmicutes bacterium]|nr:hypothetical protein [Bacillota bacterium]
MSTFIGPIHYWLFEKIRVINNREDYIFENAAAMCGETAEELREQVWQTYGKKLPDVDLGELIEHDNIHGWLQRQINIAESREAAFIKELLEVCGDAGVQLLGKAFREHGKAYGENARAQGKYELDTAPGIYKALNDYYLNGMPCDQADMVIESRSTAFIWDKGAYTQLPNWKRVGVDAKVMNGFYEMWLGAFVDGANKAFGFRSVNCESTARNVVARYEIYKK